jgi:MFS family permease
MLGSSAFLLSLISTVASLPFFLFTLPAGALADMVNRRRLLCFMNLWLAGAAVLLAILSSFPLLNPLLYFLGANWVFAVNAQVLKGSLSATDLPTTGCCSLYMLAESRHKPFPEAL